MRSGDGTRIAVIGAGFGGIGAAVRLKQSGFENFTVFEKASGPGGTWWHNTYPGAEVDVNSFLYSFSFHRFDWSRSHARQPEIQAYLEDTLDTFGVRDNFRFDTKVDSVEWDDGADVYRLHIAGVEQPEVFDLVISAVGFLSEPNMPTWPGIERFAGPIFHTSAWEHQHDLEGKEVAVVGTGSTAAQVVPAIAPKVKSLTLFQREPGWVIPKDERDFSVEERRRYERDRLAYTRERWKEFRAFTKALTVFQSGSPMQKELEKIALDYIDETIEDPAVKEAVTPRYQFGCKRPVIASSFYPALNRDNVTVVPQAVTAVTETGLVAADGVERRFDLVVLSTGFRAQDFLHSLDVKGVGGRDLREFWNGRPQAVAGSTVPGFPNFFMLLGPNTNGGGSVVYQLECQIEMLVAILKRYRRSNARRIATRPGFYEKYNAWLDGQSRKYFSATVPTACHNYYYSESGHNVTNWPRSALRFRLTTELAARLAMELK